VWSLERSRRLVFMKGTMGTHRCARDFGTLKGVVMKTYPIHVPWHTYAGQNPRRIRAAQRHNQIAKLCEDNLNRKISECPDEIQQYVYVSIAVDLNLTTEEVYKVMFPVDCGHNAITVRKTPVTVS
jgi:hypothetical protein